ncbi:pilus assembly protein TadG-related protein [Evansella sp. AB-P1]|uniref:pilus assembly protein TadG-related protein n=1 Tax=Evansella sp. AB-P1 TaxID=3037653 RepID=UPI00241D9D7E|nr:pilus assembly protein TadG-related protein [Evansella sp. AB-P1]MDG5790059.1 pilus assembly protein TadG-related protein [Evansella sp. AB-P1]
MEKLLKLIKSEKGNVLVLVSIAFTGILTMAGLVIDGGNLYVTKSHLQKVANAAVLSGAQELVAESETEVETIVQAILQYHEEELSLDHLDILLDDSVTVELEKPVPLAFSRLLGMETVNVSAKATARIGAMGRAYGAAPIGIDDSIELEFGELYQLKVDEEDVDTGNFGILALEGPGANTYKDNLLNGFQGELAVGDIVDTQTGNIAGPTKDAVDILVAGCSSMYERDCSRIILVPVYTPHNHTQNQMKEVEITGFAYFYIEQYDNSDKTIHGYFIRRADTGFEDPSASNKGAYSIRLTE